MGTWQPAKINPLQVAGQDQDIMFIKERMQVSQKLFSGIASGHNNKKIQEESTMKLQYTGHYGFVCTEGFALELRTLHRKCRKHIKPNQRTKKTS